MRASSSIQKVFRTESMSFAWMNPLPATMVKVTRLDDGSWGCKMNTSNSNTPQIPDEIETND